ncbi:hypothetical protein JW826_00810 [Candidatus Woesearchaeota archaeon]|nr:hypothetical protein [Candidatus Woesearchaeota archaeon]
MDATDSKNQKCSSYDFIDGLRLVLGKAADMTYKPSFLASATSGSIEIHNEKDLPLEEAAKSFFMSQGLADITLEADDRQKCIRARKNRTDYEARLRYADRFCAVSVSVRDRH